MNNKNIYEIGLLINPNLPQQKVEETVEKVEKIVSKNNASVISKGEIVDIELAYQIITKIGSANERFDKAYFTWVKFESETSNMDAVKTEVDKIKKEVFRYLITKTVADDEQTDKFSLDFMQTGESEVAVEELETNDLTKIEGIGPKTAEALATKGIVTFKDLAETSVEDLKALLLEDSTLSKFDPKTWPEQAKLAFEEKWDELEKWQDELDGGVE
ncbi:hypothetical protein CSB11_02930 [Candidatus Campbellbacteria bacterium]|nr:MAG: hypothetical protein CSB11_02930 [Candidatus Campbellbacteria bacterium]